PAPPAPPAPPSPPAVKPHAPAPQAPHAQPQVVQIPQPKQPPQPNPVAAKPNPNAKINPNGKKPGAPGPKTANTAGVPGKGPPTAPMGNPGARGTNGKTGKDVLASTPNLKQRTERVVTQATDNKKAAEIVEKNLKEMDDWILYELDGGKSPKDAMPGIFIGNTSVDEWKDIIGHFDLCPIAYPDSKDKFILIDLVKQTLAEGKSESAFQALSARYAATGISFPKSSVWGSDLFAGAAQKACDTYNIPRRQLNLMILAPKQVISYLAWKALRTLKDLGFDPAKVRACNARFSRTTDGWILKVTSVVLEDGSVRQVRT
ncbi:MAG: hypothetical protein ACAI25_00475, partial [Planctomycetota bacterium]